MFLKILCQKNLSDEEVLKIVTDAIKELNATSIKQMGAVVNKVRPILQGKADMGQVSLKLSLCFHYNC